MRVGVVGAGAMGSVFGAMYAAAGNDVFFVDVNEAIVDAINADGLVITRRDGAVDTYRIAAVSNPIGLPPADLILFQVKGYATATAARLVRPVVTNSTTILTLQNGLGNEETLREAFIDSPLLIGMSVHSVTMTSPGRYHHTGVRASYLGPSEERWFDRAQDAVDALHGSGYEVHVEHAAEIHREIYAKWVLNCGSLPVFAVTGLETSAVNGNETVLSVIDGLTREACDLAAAAGYALDADERVAYNRGLFQTAGGKASMLQDIEAGRRTEIDTINGAAVMLSDRFGIAAPLNRALFALVKGRQAAMGVLA
jgi:2-dehydropantoate 2-reductase